MISRQAAYEGCMIGLAVGDSLGAPVEFMSRKDIYEKFGHQGIQELIPWGGLPAGSITDDTQMSIATAKGTIRIFQEGTINPELAVYSAYAEWLMSQNIPYERRAPGNTCISALASGDIGFPTHPINDSKGCGGVMRTAPCGLLHPKESTPFHWGARCAAITHGHIEGWYPAGILAEIIHMIAFSAANMSLEDIIDDVFKFYPTYIDREFRNVQGDNTLDLYSLFNDAPDPEMVGGGWVGDEALIMAIVACLRTDNFKDAVIMAANVSGDSDSVASIAGAIAGAYYGIESIPNEWVEVVEHRDTLFELADTLLQHKELMEKEKKEGVEKWEIGKGQ